MKFKYFKITEQSTLDHIEECLVSVTKRERANLDLSKKFGAKEVFMYDSGGIGYFVFDSLPDMTLWKKVKHGFMPRAKTNEQNLMRELPEQLQYNDIIKKYNLGGEMIIGERVNGRGFSMHSSYVRGSRKSGFYAIVVPYQKDFDRDIDDSLVEIKEWELLKEIEEAS